MLAPGRKARGLAFSHPNQPRRGDRILSTADYRSCRPSGAGFDKYRKPRADARGYGSCAPTVLYVC